MMVAWIEMIGGEKRQMLDVFQREPPEFLDGLDIRYTKEEGSEEYPRFFTLGGWMESPSIEMEKAMGGTGFPTIQPLVLSLGWKRRGENMGGSPSQ